MRRFFALRDGSKASDLVQHLYRHRGDLARILSNDRLIDEVAKF
jgi:hypothetical protein